MLLSHPAVRVAGKVKPDNRRGKKSASGLFSPAALRHLAKLEQLFRLERRAKLMEGDTLVHLIDDCHLRPIDIGRQLHQRPNDLSQMYHTARMFPPAVRKPHVPYNHYLMAMRMIRKFKQLRMSPMRVLAEVMKRGFTQHRQVTAHFASKLRQQESRKAMQMALVEPGGQSFCRCYHAPFQSLLGVFPNGSIKIIHADPPYANYRRVADGRYSGGNLARTDSDSATAEAATAVTVDLLRDWRPKLQVGGVLLLWQSSGPLRPQIVMAVEQFGWEVETVVIWDKGHTQPGNFELPYSTQCEWLWVAKHRGDRLINHDKSPRGDVLRFTPVHKAVTAAEQSHAFEKPLDLCTFPGR